MIQKEPFDLLALTAETHRKMAERGERFLSGDELTRYIDETLDRRDDEQPQTVLASDGVYPPLKGG